MSRYGIDVPLEVVRCTILQGLGGGSGNADVIDLMELSAIILIPILLKSAAAMKDKETVRSRRLIQENSEGAIEQTYANSNKNKPLDNDTTDEPESYFGSVWKKMTTLLQNNDEKVYGDSPVAESDPDILGRDPTLPDGVLLPPEDLFDFASKVILHDITGDSKSKLLTIDLIKDMLIMYGEYDIANNEELLQEMLKCATKGSLKDENQNPEEEVAIFNGTMLSRAATFDVQQYDLSNENKMTTLYDDVFPPQLTLRGKMNPYEVTQGDTFDNENDGKNNNNSNDEQHKHDKFGNDLYTTKFALKRKFIAPAIDVTAGTFRSKTLIVLLWGTAILFFCAYYLTSANGLVSKAYCTNQGFVYNQTVSSAESLWITNSGAVACDIGISVVAWLLLFLKVGAFGLAFTALGSIGNTIECREFWHPLVGCVPVLILSLVMLTIYSDEPYLTVITVSAFILSCIVIYLHVTHALSVLVSEEYLLEHPVIQEKWLSEERITWLRKVLKPRMTEAELLAKKAMAYKLNTMIENALLLVKQYDRDNVIDTYYGRAIQAFSKYGVRSTENVGGTFWTYKNIWNKHIFDREGVWYSVRVLASNIGQLIVCIFVIWAGSQFMQLVEDNFEDKDQVKVLANNLIQQEVQKQQAELMTANVSSMFGTYMYDLQANNTMGVNCSDYNSADTISICRTDGTTGVTNCENTTQMQSLCALSTTQNLTAQQQVGLLEGSGFDVNQVTSMSELAIQSAVDETVDALYPNEEYMVTVPVGIAIFVAFLSSVLLATTYISNVTSTILQLRCGNIETLRNLDSQLYRAAPDTVALLTGSIFWGCLASSILTGSFVGLIVFLFLWQATVYFAQRFLALFIGILVITILKLLCLLVFRGKAFAGFYRTNPLVANIGILALEWANFTLSAGIIFVRLIKLLLIAMFSVGRMYRPFLAKGIGRVGPIELDGFPTVHLRELLAHEAHRHPYIELLGYVYLMKLRHSDEFGKSAGTCWRYVLLLYFTLLSCYMQPI